MTQERTLPAAPDNAPVAEPEVPDWVLEEIEHPLAMGEGRNNQMVKIGPTMLRHGMDPEALEEKFHEMYPDIGPKQLREIHACVRNCIKIAAREQKDFDKSQYGKRKMELDRMAIEARQSLPGILVKYAWPEWQIREAGNWAFLEKDQLGLMTQRRAFLSTLFAADDVVWIGAVWQTGKPKHKGRFMQNQSWLTMQRISGEFCSHCTFKPGSFSRSNENVEVRRFMVVESDILSIDECGAIFNYLASYHSLPLRAIVYTGGKSLHGWFDWPGDEVVDEWSAKLSGWNCDPSTLRPSQPVRLPGIIRTSTRRPQELLYLS
jgi:hypothetical protein